MQAHLSPNHHALLAEVNMVFSAVYLWPIRVGRASPKCLPACLLGGEQVARPDRRRAGTRRCGRGRLSLAPNEVGFLGSSADSYSVERRFSCFPISKWRAE